MWIFNYYLSYQPQAFLLLIRIAILKKGRNFNHCFYLKRVHKWFFCTCLQLCKYTMYNRVHNLLLFNTMWHVKMT